MALVKYGGGVVQMSGSIGGDTFARNRYGNYVRARTKPTNPNTARQIAVRTSMALLTVRWAQTLTATQRTAWNLYGASVTMKNRIGENTFLTGFNHYIRSNSILARGSYTLIDDGPTIFELPAQDPAFSMTASEATQLTTFTYNDLLDWASETGGYLWLFQGQPQNAQRNFFGGPWRFTSVVTGVDAAPPASPHVTGVSFAIAELQHVWAYARISRADGRLSEPFRSDIAVGA